MITVYPWDKEVSEKVYNTLVNEGKVDPNYAIQRKMPKRIYESRFDGTQVVRNAGMWLLVPTKDTKNPWGHLLNHCRIHDNVKVITKTKIYSSKTSVSKCIKILLPCLCSQ